MNMTTMSSVDSIMIVPDGRSSVEEGHLSTIVLQPDGPLDQSSSSEFQKTLKESLHQVTDGVIVDLLWVDFTDRHGIHALVAGIQQAQELGKALSFQSMDTNTRAALEFEWNRQRQASCGPWSDSFGQDLERFLDSLVEE